MSEMVERVAKAIYEKFEDRPTYAKRQMNGILAEELARAAIEAMRDDVVRIARDLLLCELTSAGSKDPYMAFSVGAKAQRDAIAKELDAALSQDTHSLPSEDR